MIANKADLLVKSIYNNLLEGEFEIAIYNIIKKI